MISNAFALAILTTCGLYVVYKKLPRKIRRLIEKYSLFADILALVGIYLMLGQTLTALMAGALAGLFISVLLHIANNQEDFLFIFDVRDTVKKYLLEAKQLAHEWGVAYRENKDKDDEPEPVPVAA
jgi:hypothetical protein